MVVYKERLHVVLYISSKSYIPNIDEYDKYFVRLTYKLQSSELQQVLQNYKINMIVRFCS